MNSIKIFALLQSRAFNAIQLRTYAQKKKQAGKAPPEAKAQTKWVQKKTAQIADDYVVGQAQVEIVDPVWLINENKGKLYTIEEAINYHKEIARPEMFNNTEGFIFTRLTLDMTTKKKLKFMDNIKSYVSYPNHFVSDSINKEVVAICKKDEEIEAARNSGALFAGYTEILKKFEKGEISDQSYDFLVCTPETLPDVMLLKKKINKDKLPSIKNNTVTEDMTKVVNELHLSKEFETMKISDERGVLKTKIGPVSYDTEKLVQNLAALINKIKSHKKYAEESFVTDCVLYMAPSTERFRVDISRFINLEKKDDDKKQKKDKKAKEEHDDDEETKESSTATASN